MDVPTARSSSRCDYGPGDSWSARPVVLMGLSYRAATPSPSILTCPRDPVPTEMPDDTTPKGVLVAEFTDRRRAGPDSRAHATVAARGPSQRMRDSQRVDHRQIRTRSRAFGRSIELAIDWRDGMTRARISVVTSLVATTMVVSGCGISAVTGTPVPSLTSAPGTPTATPLSTAPVSTVPISTVPISTTPGSTAGTTGDGPTGTAAYDRSADAVLIALTESHTTVAGPQGSSSVVVFGDGRMVRTAADGVTSEEMRIDETGVAELVSTAHERGLFDSPDFGDIQVTDTGAARLTLRAYGQVVELTIQAPGMMDDDGSPVAEARKAFSDFAQQLSSLDGIKIVDGPTPLMPKSATVTAAPILFEHSEPSGVQKWPLDGPAPTLFRTTDCIVLTGGRLPSLVELIRQRGKDQPVRQRAGAAIIEVRTGEPGPRTLRLDIDITGGPCPESAAPQPIPSDLPWAADARRIAGSWESWLAVDALQRAASARKLPIGDPGYLDDYEFVFVVGTVNGRQIIDVVATPDDDHSGRDDIPPMVARIDPDGADGPVLSKVAKR